MNKMMNRNLISKETEYSSYWMRSRLEARWAYWFDTIKVAYQYEPHQFQTAYGAYLPDFYLQYLGCWVEIKPTAPSSEEIEKIRSVADETGELAILLAGFPEVTKVARYRDGKISTNMTLNGASAYLYRKGKNELHLSADELFSHVSNVALKALIQNAFRSARKASCLGGFISIGQLICSEPKLPFDTLRYEHNNSIR